MRAIPRCIGMDGRHRTVVSRVHRLQHIERLGATHLADDNPVGTHTQRVYDQLALVDRPFALEVWRPALESDDMLLL